MTPSSQSSLLQLVHDHREQAKDGHDRLRNDVNAIGKKVAALEVVQVDLLLRLQKLELVPVNVEKVTFSSTQLVVIVSACLAIAVGMWTLRVGINDVQVTVANAAKLQDERNATQKETLDNLGRQIEMRRVEIQRVRDDLAEFTRQRVR